MKKETKTKTIVYWSPAQFTTQDEQWNLLYSEPRPVADNLITGTTGENQIVRCPATRNALHNVFSVHAPLSETIDLSNIALPDIELDSNFGIYPLAVTSRIALKRTRPSSYTGHVNVNYNLAWYLFADKPLTMRMTAPYFPASSPSPGAILATGQFDIGQWFRPINLDYHLPVSASSFSIADNDPLAFFEFHTTDTIEFKRFALTPELAQIGNECAESPTRYGQRLTLAKRYGMFRRAGLPQMVLSLIEKNLIP